MSQWLRDAHRGVGGSLHGQEGVVCGSLKKIFFPLSNRQSGTRLDASVVVVKSDSERDKGSAT